jgi:hypothetical protein
VATKKVLVRLVHDLTGQLQIILGYFNLEATIHKAEKRPLVREQAIALLATDKAIALLRKIQAALILLENGEE